MNKINGLASSKHPEYKTWLNMKGRCYDPKDISWKYYGGKGIGLCARWRTSFAAFYADMGPKPRVGYSIDRIDASRGYEPGNCRWVPSWINSRRNGWGYENPKGLVRCPVCHWSQTYFRRGTGELMCRRCGSATKVGIRVQDA